MRIDVRSRSRRPVVGALVGGVVVATGLTWIDGVAGQAPQPPPAQTVTAPPPPVDAEGAVRQAKVDPGLKSRVDAYWAARMQMNLASAYKFYDATFRSAYTEAQFLQNFQRLLRFRPEYLGIDSVSVYPSGTVAIVGVKLRTRPAELEGMELVSVSVEKWQKNGGVWYKQGEPLLPSP